ncbi:MAG: hypothetical protein J1E34_08915 [Oscillospiraceae bacterium]|nr:hypothetical protein [Oscillospiraceae bacterium]
MTQKLYYENAYIFEFTATVENIIDFEGKTAVILDKTAFFPEGGGQPGDEGYIDNAPVFDTKIDNGIIYHFISDSYSFSAGSIVQCCVNKEVRFARMQAHTGEHIVSGIAHSLFGVNNIGFHMDNTVMTVDFDKYLSKEELAKLEKAANNCVYKNVRVNAWFPNDEELKELTYRSKLDDFDETRIVEIEGYDACACCAVHLSSTGEVGLIKILTSAKHRGGVRLTLICGITAYEDYVIKYDNTLIISDLLCSKHNEANEAVIKLLQKEKELKYMIAEKTNTLIKYIFDTSEFSEQSIVFRINGLNNEELKQAAIMLKEKSAGITVIVSGDDCEGYYFAAASNAVKINDFTKIITSSLNGSGGGRYDVIQGRLNSDYNTIKSFFDKLTVN